MALTYSLVTDAEKEPADLIRWMEATQSLHPVPGEKHTIAKPGLRCSVIPQSRTGSELIQETFGINPGIICLCQIDKFDLYETGMDHLLRLAFGLLTKDQSDLLLLSNGEQGHLLRKESRIYADCSDDYWKKKWNAAFARARLHFQHRELPCI